MVLSGMEPLVSILCTPYPQKKRERRATERPAQSEGGSGSGVCSMLLPLASRPFADTANPRIPGRERACSHHSRKTHEGDILELGS